MAAVLCATLLLVLPSATLAAETPRESSAKVPGVIIDHNPASSGLYIGSPSIAILPNGDYVASHDEFGPKSTEQTRAVSHVFHSRDRGQSWKQISTINGAFWSTLFVHRGALYLLGPDHHHGNAVIRRSDDGGLTWTSPTNAATGLLRDNGEYHCAPMPILDHADRLWRAMERRDPPIAWGINYRAGMMSAPVDADLLNATNWTWATCLPSDRAWNGGDMGAWLEGNAVVAPDGEIVNILRVQTKSPDEKAAIVRVSPDGRKLSFDPARDFIAFPGGAKKFSIRFDPQTKLYWALANIVPERHRGDNPGAIRNTLALVASRDLQNWETRCVLLYHRDVVKHGFQYVDWQFDGDDLIAACRTAYEDLEGGAHNYHDANFLTFHRWKNFRSLTMTDSVPLPDANSQRIETADFIITGRAFELAALTNGAKAFSNRAYVWAGLSDSLSGQRFTQISGGERAQLTARAKRVATLTMATATSQRGIDTTGWERVPGADFSYTDAGKTRMQVFQRPIKAGEAITIPQGNWTGGVLLVR